jgi:hypothetical protein
MWATRSGNNVPGRDSLARPEGQRGVASAFDADGPNVNLGTRNFVYSEHE